MCSSTCQRIGLQSQKAQGVLLALFWDLCKRTQQDCSLGLIMLLAQPARKSDLLGQDQQVPCQSLQHSAEHA